MYRSLLRPVMIIAGLVCLTAYAVIMLRGPQGIGALNDKLETIHRLEDENATIQKKISEQKALIDKLQHDPSTQERFVRERTGKTRPGDTSFMITDPHRSNSH